jgi:hypothetical protein
MILSVFCQFPVGHDIFCLLSVSVGHDIGRLLAVCFGHDIVRLLSVSFGHDIVQKQQNEQKNKFPQN